MARAVPVVFMTYDILEQGGQRHPRRCRCASGAQRLERAARLDRPVRRRAPALPVGHGRELGRARRSSAANRATRGVEGLMLKRASLGLRRRPEARRLVEVEDRAVHDRRRADLRAAGQRQARQPADRLHLRRLARRRARAGRQGLFRPVERGDRRDGSLDPAAHASSASGRCATSSRSTSSSSASKASRDRPRHRSGIAVRFPRMLRWRKDKPAERSGHARERAAVAGVGGISLTTKLSAVRLSRRLRRGNTTTRRRRRHDVPRKDGAYGQTRRTQRPRRGTKATGHDTPLGNLVVPSHAVAVTGYQRLSPLAARRPYGPALQE